MEPVKRFLYTNYPKQYGSMINLMETVKFPFKVFFLSKGMKTYFSTKDQDRWVIEDVFKGKKNGFFVDLAATDGIRDNNSYILEHDYDWNGICVEPNPLFQEQIKENRKCHISDNCISDVEEEVEFIFNRGIGGIISDDCDNNLAKRSETIDEFRSQNKVKKVKTITFEQLLDKFNAPAEMDYLSLDIEGAETRVFRGFPFDKYLFRCMTIERPTPELNEILLNNGYLFVKNFKVDTFYIHESMKDKVDFPLEKFEQVPPKAW
jgi:FkbM family methyltransferase